MMLGRMVFTRTVVPFNSAARESNRGQGGGLGRGVGRKAGGVIDGGFGRYVHDRAAGLLQHLRRGDAGERVAGAQVHGEHLIEDFGFGFPEFCPADETTDGVYQCVQPAVLRQDVFHKLAHLRFIGDVNGVAVQSRRINRRGILQGVEILLFSIRDDDGGSFFQERQSRGVSEPDGATGGEDDVVGESLVHGSSLVFFAMMRALALSCSSYSSSDSNFRRTANP